MRLKRDRKCPNKVELTRLQRNFEANIRELDALERSKTTPAMIAALSVAMLGTAFMTGAVFTAVCGAGDSRLCGVDCSLLPVPPSENKKDKGSYAVH